MSKNIRQYSIIIFFLLLTIFVSCGNQQKKTPRQTQKDAPKVATSQPEAAHTTPWYKIYFSHVYQGNPQAAKQDPANIDKILAQKIKAAKLTIDAALYELDSNTITDALIFAHRRGVKVRLVTETDYMAEASIERLFQAGIPVRNDGGRGSLMHNKFLIFDRQAIWTGSFNTTDNGAYKNNNNAIYIRSPKLAENFSAEFNEMYESNQFGSRSPKTIPYTVITMPACAGTADRPDKTKIITLFSPENNVAGVIINKINRAKHSIYFMIFSFTHDGIGNAMIAKYKAGIDVKGIFESRNSETPYSEYPKMLKLGIPVKQDSNPYLLHHKVIIIDQNTTITGSFNFSQNAAETNDENILIIEGNREIAQTYLEEFNRLYTASTPASTSTQPEITTKININTATAEELQKLPGIGKTLAKRIVEYRRAHGPFVIPQDITKVKGIGKKTYEEIKDKISL